MRSCSTNVDRITPFADLKYESRIHSLHTAAASTSTSKLGLFLHSLQSKRPCECLLRAVFVARSSCVRSLSVVRSLFFARRHTKKKFRADIERFRNLSKAVTHRHTDRQMWLLAPGYVLYRCCCTTERLSSAAANRSANVKL